MRHCSTPDNIAGLITSATEYAFSDDADPHTSAYLWGPVLAELRRHDITRAFEVGCGNGALARYLTDRGIAITGVDPSHTGVSIANRANSRAHLEIGSAYEDLRARFGTFPAVISLEVVEHLYFPRQFAACIAELLEPHGIALISTPYHGYWKNLLLAITGGMDAHFTALWDHGHIKFWSPRTLSALLQEQSLFVESIHRLGRIPSLAKSMLVVAVRKLR